MGGTFSQFPRSCTSIVNEFSAGGTALEGADAIGYVGLQVLSGELTAATYKEMLSVTGAGMIDLAGVQAVNATSRTLGLKIIIDGVTVFDAVSAACTTTGAVQWALGRNTMLNGASWTTASDIPAYFSKSLSISIKSSLNETNKVKVIYKYYLHA